MRLKPIPPDQLTDEQRPFYEQMKSDIATHLKGFVTEQDDGALVGPFNPMLHHPEWGKPAWDYTKSLMEHSTVAKPVREVAILVVGAAHRARYELYAHERVAALVGLSESKIATICAGQRPNDLTPEEAAAYDIAAALMRGGSLPETTYNVGVSAFGEKGLAELVYLVGAYSLVSVILNAFDTPVPDQDGGEK